MRLPLQELFSLSINYNEDSKKRDGELDFKIGYLKKKKRVEKEGSEKEIVSI